MKANLKPIIAALGLGMALSAGPASALINWNTPGITLFEDDDIDFHIDNNGNGFVDPGDELIAILELNTANGVDIGPGQELTGVAHIGLTAFADLDGVGGLNDMVFDPVAGSIPDNLVAGGMVAFWLDNSPDLAISAGDVVGGTVSCANLAACLAQATDGDLWQVDGKNGTDADDYWIALNAEQNAGTVLAASPGQAFGNVNAGLSILFNGTGQNLVEDWLDCGLLCAPGGNNFVDMIGSGSIKGGAGLSVGLIADGAFATSDFDITKKTVPEPTSLALMGFGLLGLLFTTQRRRKA